MTNKIFLVADQVTVYGAGKNKNDAIADSAKWLCDQNGQQGVTVAYVNSRVISEHESKHGASGVFIIEYTAEWPENADQMDGDQWFNHYYSATNQD